LFVLLISRFNVCVLAAVTIGICSTWYFEDLFFVSWVKNNCSHRNVLLFIKQIWKTNWITSGYETTILNEISHRRFCRMDNNYISGVRGSSAWYCET
jgi:hypothetical protein